MSSDAAPNESEVLELIGTFLDGAADEEQRRRLVELLETSPEARRLYRRYVNLHVALRTNFALTDSLRSEMERACSAGETNSTSEVTSPRPQRARRTRVAVLALCTAASVVAVWIATQLPWRALVPQTESIAFAELTKSSGARWLEGRDPSQKPGQLQPGLLHLAEGLAEVTLHGGVRMVLEAPVRIRLVSAGLATLELGRVVTFVPEQARGFSIDTPRARLVDLGTEFGVVVKESGVTDVQVFQGEVSATLNDDASKTEQVLTAGRAVTFEASGKGQGIPFEPQRFVRMFPAENNARQPAGPLYNRSRHDTVHVVPAPLRGVSIDGDLSDWDPSGRFTGACMPPFNESHTISGMMMYDAENVYLAGHVGDPAPMQSLVDPQSGMGWRGGSVIVRLSTSPDLGWPLDAKGSPLATSEYPDYGSRPQDVSNSIVHLTLWYHRPTESPQLHLSYGMDFHDDERNPAGWQGAYRRDTDGLGYTFEYKVSWKSLRAGERVPRAGDTLAANWTVHWSDQDGTLSRGHLAEITNFDQQPHRFQRGETWGKALYHAQGNLPPELTSPRAP